MAGGQEVLKYLNRFEVGGRAGVGAGDWNRMETGKRNSSRQWKMG